jgi:hypothetical protein
VKRIFKPAILRSKRARLALALGVLLLILVIVGRHLMAPVHGRATKSDIKPQKTLSSSETESSPSVVNQQYFSLNLPAGYVAQEALTPGGTQLFSQTIIKPSGFGSTLINIGIKNLPEGGLSEDPSFTARQQQSGRYQLTIKTVNGETVHVANDRESAVVVAFWVHNKYLATISVSQGINNPAADDNIAGLKVLDVILQAWQWN